MGVEARQPHPARRSPGPVDVEMQDSVSEDVSYRAELLDPRERQAYALAHRAGQAFLGDLLGVQLPPGQLPQASEQAPWRAPDGEGLAAALQKAAAASSRFGFGRGRLTGIASGSPLSLARQ